MMRYLGYLLILFLILLGLVFASLNTEPVKLSFYVMDFTLPLSLAIIFSFASGCLLGLSLGLVRYLHLKNQKRQQQLQIGRMEAELAHLRALSPKDSTGEDLPCT
jgi:uncharacterized integral membrane protein